jgi:hypothetical protein
MSLFEIGMLVCFGVSWPISISKSLRTHAVDGKSPLFMVIVMIGYLCGLFHKLFFSRDWVASLYILNFLMVGMDLILYYRYRTRR